RRRVFGPERNPAAVLRARVTSFWPKYPCGGNPGGTAPAGDDSRPCCNAAQGRCVILRISRRNLRISRQLRAIQAAHSASVGRSSVQYPVGRIAAMKIIILGAGVIGVTSAWYLARAGHEVTVVDRQPAAALETSLANAGEIAPGYSTPWAAPGIPQQALKWLFQRDAPLVLHASADRARARWMLQMLGNCTSGAYATNKSRM